MMWVEAAFFCLFILHYKPFHVCAEADYSLQNLDLSGSKDIRRHLLQEAPTPPQLICTSSKCTVVMQGKVLHKHG